MCLFPFWGFKQDIDFFVSWAAFTLEHPITEIYDDPTVFDHGLINYPPLYLYILAMLAKVYTFCFDNGLETKAFLCFLKSVTVLFEVFTTYLLYKYVRVNHSGEQARFASAAYFLNPAVLYVGSYYGQVDAIFTSLLFASVVLVLMGRAFWSGCFIAAALMAKIQTVPFVPVVFFIALCRSTIKGNQSLLPALPPPASLTEGGSNDFALLRQITKGGKWTALAWQIGGFTVAGVIILLPFILVGKAGLVYERCISENLAWSYALSVSAFNPWFLHPDPNTWDYRIWGWLYGSDGMVTAHPLILMLTYKNLGLALLGCSFLYALYLIWRRCDKEMILLAFAWVSLAFFMFPTKVHERYLYPFFCFYVILYAVQPRRKWLYWGFTLTYLMNLMVICPLIGDIKQPEDFDSTLGVWIAGINVILLAVFVRQELIQSVWGNCCKHWRVALVPAAAVIAVFFILQRFEKPPAEPDVLYLSSIPPALPPTQDWPPIPPEYGGELPHPYFLLGKNHSTGVPRPNELRIYNTLFRYGLGTHAESEIVYDVPGAYTHFESYIGIDYETMPMYKEHPNRATAVFEVWVNGEKQYESGLKIPATPPELVRIRLPLKRAVNRITLRVKNGDGYVFSDHADWALARVIESFKPAGDRQSNS